MTVIMSIHTRAVFLRNMHDICLEKINNIGLRRRNGPTRSKGIFFFNQTNFSFLRDLNFTALYRKEVCGILLIVLRDGVVEGAGYGSLIGWSRGF